MLCFFIVVYAKFKNCALGLFLCTYTFKLNENSVL